ncbi:MAG TPA: TPM domain-containing protein [Pseudomonadales bacterium]|nr:TPM domain-containing protein [Pseudomonadales bacterium]
MTTKWQRLIKNFFITPIHAQRCFPKSALERIHSAIVQSEKQHRGEIRFVLEHALSTGEVMREASARDRATLYFSKLKIWDTEDNTGVLIYVLLAERSIEILADRGINKAVGQAFWDEVCLAMQQDFRAQNYEQGVVKAIATITQELIKHFPATGNNPNELPDQPLIV